MWDEREKFFKEGRGGCEGVDEDFIDEFDFDELMFEEKEELGLVKLGDKDGKVFRLGVDYGFREVDDNMKWWLDVVEEFYKEVLL